VKEGIYGKKISIALGGIFVYVSLIGVVNVSFAENIDPYDDGSQYAYGENVGWLCFFLIFRQRNV